MARQKGSANFAGTLEVLAGGPIDSRSIVPTLADLTVASNFPYPYQYMEVRVTATGKKYKLVGNDLTVAANWVEIEETGGSQITVDSALSTTSENPVQNKVITNKINTKADAENIGDLEDLTTTAKTDLVSAINEAAASSASYTAGDGIDISNDEISIDPMPAADMEEIMTPLPNVMPRHFGPGGGFAPVGTVISFMGVNPPQDYLACDGTVYNIANYPQLAKFFEDQFGSKNYFGGNGTTTFAVPDLRGEFLRGTGTNGHPNQGNGGNVGAHQNSTKVPMVYFDGQYNEVAIFMDNTTARTMYPLDSDKSVKTFTGTLRYSEYRQDATAATGYTIDSATIRPTNTSILWCIKAIEDGEKYSTTERKVGTWIDGKPVYQKTIDCGALPNSTNKTVAHNVSNINIIVRAFGFAVNADHQSMFLSYVSANALGENVGYFADRTNIYIGDGYNWSSFTKTYITIQYTKTTD